MIAIERVHPVALDAGLPKIFYHGSSHAEDIVGSGYFDPDLVASNRIRMPSPGFFFTDDIDLAQRFTRSKLENTIEENNVDLRNNRIEIDALNSKINAVHDGYFDECGAYEQLEFFEDKDQKILDKIASLTNELDRTKHKKGVVEVNLLVEDPLIVVLPRKHMTSDVTNSIENALISGKDSLVVYNEDGSMFTVVVFNPSRIIGKNTQRPMTPYCGPHIYEAGQSHC